VTFSWLACLVELAAHVREASGVHEPPTLSHFLVWLIAIDEQDAPIAFQQPLRYRSAAPTRRAHCSHPVIGVEGLT
jgi:hypothetical protein